MERGLMMYRRDLPGGHSVMISVDEREPGTVVGRLQIERRTDPERQREGTPPVVAEVRGESRDVVLDALRQIADSDVDVRERLETWLAARRGAAERRAQMPDGSWWSVERRHEMTQLSKRGSARERRLYLFFRNDAGGLRRAEVPDDFAADADTAEVQLAFVRAEILQ